MKFLFAIMMCFSAYAQDLEVSNARVRFFPASVKTTGAFMDIHNKSDKHIKIVKAESSVSEKTELHNHFLVDGMMKMREVEYISVPARGTVHLKPGSFHVMLIQLKKPLQLGQKVVIKLHLDNGKIMEVHPTVQNIKMMKHH